MKVAHAFGLNLGDMAAEAGARVVPGRNLLLLSLAANLFPDEPIVIGCNASDALTHTQTAVRTSWTAPPKRWGWQSMLL